MGITVVHIARMACQFHAQFFGNPRVRHQRNESMTQRMKPVTKYPAPFSLSGAADGLVFDSRDVYQSRESVAQTKGARRLFVSELRDEGVRWGWVESKDMLPSPGELEFPVWIAFGFPLFF